MRRVLLVAALVALVALAFAPAADYPAARIFLADKISSVDTREWLLDLARKP